ncbi:MAG: GNAT family N-acetyltransferase [Caldilineaceae bacterium]
MFRWTRPTQAKKDIYFRRIQVQDVGRLMNMHRRVSQASLTNRYFRPYMPTQTEVANICALSDQRGAAYVAIAHGEIVGLGYYMVDEHNCEEAEIAFLVEDGFQGRGIGRSLSQLLVQHALQHCISALTAYVLPTNEQMMRIFRGAGYLLKERIAYGAREVRLELTVPDFSFDPFAGSNISMAPAAFLATEAGNLPSAHNMARRFLSFCRHFVVQLGSELSPFRGKQPASI